MRRRADASARVAVTPSPRSCVRQRAASAVAAHGRSLLSCSSSRARTSPVCWSLATHCAARELAVRRALGATPWQLARQSLVDAGVLAAAGGTHRHCVRGRGASRADCAQSRHGRALVRDACGCGRARRMSADYRGGDARRRLGPGTAVETVRRDQFDERAFDARSRTRDPFGHAACPRGRAGCDHVDPARGECARRHRVSCGWRRSISDSIRRMSSRSISVELDQSRYSTRRRTSTSG